MVVMLVFGLLSVSGSGADLRLAQKASESQKIYYGLDSDGENLMAFCSGAAASAWDEAKAETSDGRTDYGLFRSKLEKKLKAGSTENHFTFRADNSGITVESSIRSKINENWALKVTLVCEKPKEGETPSFRIGEWKAAVGGTQVSSPSIQVWDGK